MTPAAKLVHDCEVALHLAVDIVVFTAVLYFTGGPTNPFVSLYLVPISLASTSLPARYAWLTVAMCTTASGIWVRNTSSAARFRMSDS